MDNFSLNTNYQKSPKMPESKNCMFYLLSVIKKTSCIIILLFIAQCSKDEDRIVLRDYEYAIYLLKNSELKIDDILTKAIADQDSIALSKIKIQNHPWLTNEDIDFYDFSSHLIYLKQDKSVFLPERIDLDFPTSWWDKPFVVVANGQKRYVGVFSSSFSFNKWPIPEINDGFNFISYPSDLLIIQWMWFPAVDLNDSRHDSIVKQALFKANILHEGIEAKLNKILFTENTDTAAVEYTYTIINNDLDNLYVFDPDKMGSDLYHFYNNGPSFLKSDEVSTREAIYAKPEIPEPRDYWNPDWFVKINSGDSIVRTVKIRGYSYFPQGTYYCILLFQGHKKIPKDQRVLPDGRYLIGQTSSDLIGIQF